jgi:hypothetical protein
MNRWGFWVVVVVAAECGGRSTSAPDAAWSEQTLQGRLKTASEEHSFQLCGQAERWWWSFDRLEKGHVEGYERWSEAAKSTCADASVVVCNMRVAYVKAIGLVSPPGVYGHSGMYVREVDIVRIDEASADPPGSCSFP